MGINYLYADITSVCERTGLFMLWEKIPFCFHEDAKQAHSCSRINYLSWYGFCGLFRASGNKMCIFFTPQLLLNLRNAALAFWFRDSGQMIFLLSYSLLGPTVCLLALFKVLILNCHTSWPWLERSLVACLTALLKALCNTLNNFYSEVVLLH